MRRVGIIGGTGSLALAAHARSDVNPADTRCGVASGPFLRWSVGETEFCFLPRHGLKGTIPPHRVNYRANILAMQGESPDCIIGLNAVGGIAPAATAARLVIPDQLVDYTWGRAHTYSDGVGDELQHVDFSEPFSARVRARLLGAARESGLDAVDGGVCGVTQGPRLETAAEVNRLERDGCDIVSMTVLPEAALARELALDYAVCAVVVNRAAGRTAPGEGIHDEIRASIAAGIGQARALLERFPLTRPFPAE